MFKNISLTGSGIAILAFTVVLHYFNIVPEDVQIETIVVNLFTLAGWGMTIYGQWRRGDVNWLLFRKPTDTSL